MNFTKEMETKVVTPFTSTNSLCSKLFMNLLLNKEISSAVISYKSNTISLVFWLGQNADAFETKLSFISIYNSIEGVPKSAEK